MLNLETLGSSSSGNCYIIRVKGETLLIECGFTYKKISKSLDFDFSNVVGCLVSHAHKDHSKAVKDLCHNGIDVFCTTGTLMDMKFKDPRITVIEPEIQFKLSSFIILPFHTEHDATESVGFLIYHKEFGRLMFLTDSYYCKYNFPNLNYIMIETNYSKEILNRNIDKGLIPKILRKRIRTSHFSLENVKKYLEKLDLSNVKEIMLIHTSDANLNLKKAIDEIQGLTGKPTRALI